MSDPQLPLPSSLPPSVTPAVDEGGPPPRLSTRSFVAALVALLTVFVSLNPIWDAPDVNGWNENVWYSYAPIPLVVAALLAWERKLSFPSLAYETMRLTLWKFFITYVVANSVWAIHGPPASGLPQAEPPGHSSQAGPFAVGAAPAFVAPAAESLARLHVVVRDAVGAPVPGALVWAQGHWDGLSFAPPETPAQLSHDGRSFAPALALVSAWQPLQLVSRTDELHTAVLAPAAGGADLFNYPLVARATREVMFRRGFGLLEVACMAHRSSEPTSRLLVLDHPFGGFSDAMGSLDFDGVPAGALTLTALLPDGSRRTQELTLLPGAPGEVVLAP